MSLYTIKLNEQNFIKNEIYVKFKMKKSSQKSIKVDGVLNLRGIGVAILSAD